MIGNRSYFIHKIVYSRLYGIKIKLLIFINDKTKKDRVVFWYNKEKAIEQLKDSRKRYSKDGCKYKLLVEVER